MKKITFDPVDWSYDEKENWCSTHQHQSPINIVPQSTDPLIDEKTITLNYPKKLDTILDTGYCVQGYLKGTATINDQLYEVVQFHFHTPSEHTFNNTSYPMELHILHQDKNKNFTVLAVLFEIGEYNEIFDLILNHLNETDFNNTIDLLNLIPQKKDYYHYIGSLTTPPLTENVQWFVFVHRMSISKKQLNRLRTIHNNNFRKTQPLNNRPVFKRTF